MEYRNFQLLFYVLANMIYRRATVASIKARSTAGPHWPQMLLINAKSSSSEVKYDLIFSPNQLSEKFLRVSKLGADMPMDTPKDSCSAAHVFIIPHFISI